MKQEGYTLVELLTVGCLLMVAIGAIAAIYIVVHFIGKFW